MTKSGPRDADKEEVLLQLNKGTQVLVKVKQHGWAVTHPSSPSTQKTFALQVC